MAWGKLITDKISSFYDFRDGPPKHPFCKMTLIQKFNLFPRSDRAFSMVLMILHSCDAQEHQLLDELKWLESRVAWNQSWAQLGLLELSGNGIESVLRGWAPDLEAKAHQHESVRVNPQPHSGLILSHSNTTREGLDHYHGTPESYKVSQHEIQSKTHTGLSINLSRMAKVASPCHRTPAWDWTGGRLFAHHITLDVVLL